MAAYSQSRITTMLAAIDGAATADAKGAALEELSRYLFEKIPGVECVGQNILDEPRAHELDLAFWNDQLISSLSFLEAVLVVECKATGTAVGSAEVGWYVRKLQDRGARHGVLIALSGITGHADGASSGHSEVLTALIRDGIRILVISRPEINTLRSSNDLVRLLKSKLLELTLKRVVEVDQ